MWSYSQQADLAVPKYGTFGVGLIWGEERGAMFEDNCQKVEGICCDICESNFDSGIFYIVDLVADRYRRPFHNPGVPDLWPVVGHRKPFVDPSNPHSQR